MSEAKVIEISNLIAAAKFADGGWFVFPVHSIDKAGKCTCGSDCGSPGKHPRTKRGFLDATREADQINAWWTEWPDAGIGLSLGASGLVAVDVDPRNDGDHSFVELEKRNGPLPPTLTNLTGGGGQHYIFKLPDGVDKVPSSVPAQGVEIKSWGGYIILPPSKHASGRQYCWDSGQPEEPARAPFWLCEKRAKKDQTPTRSPSDGCVGIAFIAAGMAGARLGPDRMAVKCPWQHEHSMGKEFDTSTVVFGPAGNEGFGWFHCSHSSCQARFHGKRPGERWAMLCAVLPASAIEEARIYMPQKSKRAEILATLDPWEHSLRWNAAGTALTKETGNLALLLSNMSEWKGVFRYDESRDRVYWAKGAPAFDGLKPPELSSNIGDWDYIYISQWFALHKRYRATFTKEQIRDNVLSIANMNRHNSLLDYLNTLEWDKVSRLERWLTLYLGAEDTAYTRMAASKWLISAMARAYEPGCQADYVLTLEGKQGVGKTSTFRILGGEWYVGNHARLDDKDARIQLVNAWINEFQELAAFRGVEQQKIKAFITDKEDRYRPPYGAYVVSRPRRCVFGASTNEGEYISDTTGARRFWPVRCTRARTDLLERDRDLLLAEARDAYKAGLTWWPGAEREAYSEELEEEQELRIQGHPWEAPLRQYLAKQEQRAGEEQAVFHIHSLLGIWVEPSKQEHRHARELGALLRKIGYERHRQRNAEGKPEYIWRLPDSAKPR